VKTIITKEESAVIGMDKYSWYKFIGKRATIIGLKKKVELSPGDLYGVRLSSSGKESRLITKKLGETKVFTIDAPTLAKLGKVSSSTKIPKGGPASPKPAPEKPAAKVVKPVVKKTIEEKPLPASKQIAGLFSQAKALVKQLNKLDKNHSYQLDQIIDRRKK
jgi:hypothetical protein